MTLVSSRRNLSALNNEVLQICTWYSLKSAKIRTLPINSSSLVIRGRPWGRNSNNRLACSPSFCRSPQSRRAIPYRHFASAIAFLLSHHLPIAKPTSLPCLKTACSRRIPSSAAFQFFFHNARQHLTSSNLLLAAPYRHGLDCARRNEPLPKVSIVQCRRKYLRAGYLVE